MALDWAVASGIAASLAALIAVGTLIYAIMSGRKQAQQLANQTRGISIQTELLRKQIFGEIYEEARIRGLEFFLPEKKKHPVHEFESLQQEKQELSLGKTVRIGKGREIELHARFWMDAPQKLRAISWGFVDNLVGKNYEGHPEVLKLQRAFVVEKTSQFEREIYKDWHGHWRMEFPFSRFLPKDEVYVLCFIVKGDDEGKFPLAVNIRTEEAKNPFREELWIEVLSEIDRDRQQTTS